MLEELVEKIKALNLSAYTKIDISEDGVSIKHDASSALPPELFREALIIVKMVDKSIYRFAYNHEKNTILITLK